MWLIVGAGSAGSVTGRTPFSGRSADWPCHGRGIRTRPRPIHGWRTQISNGSCGCRSALPGSVGTALPDDPDRRSQAPGADHAGLGGWAARGAVNGRLFLPWSTQRIFDGWGLPGLGGGVGTYCRTFVLSRLTWTSAPLCMAPDGPIIVRRISEFDGCTAAFVRAAGEAGCRWVDDLNGATLEQVRLADGRPARYRSTSTAETRSGPWRRLPGAPRWAVRTSPLLTNTRVGPRAHGPQAGRSECDCGWGPTGCHRSHPLIGSCCAQGAIGSAHPADAVPASGPQGVLQTRGGYRVVGGPGPLVWRAWTTRNFVIAGGTGPTSHGLPPLERRCSAPTVGLEIRPYTAGFGRHGQ